MKKIFLRLLLVIFMTNLVSCKDYLDVIPDNIATIEDTFKNRTNAEKFLHTCYSYLPVVTSTSTCPDYVSGDEIWLFSKGTQMARTYAQSTNTWDIARGEQNSNDPLLNFWDGRMSGIPLFIAIRDCNIFLENIDKPIDLTSYQRDRWTGEVKFLKAYYHFYLMRLYGPIPIIKENIDVGASPEEVRIYRKPIDEVVNYIVGLIDESLTHLPPKILSEATENGRITQSIAKTIKAQVLLFAASPLFNGNASYTNLTDTRGIKLFPQEYDANKWKLAADACLEAIKTAQENGHELFESNVNDVTDSTLVKISLREAIHAPWNKEQIWSSNGNVNLRSRLTQFKYLAAHLAGENAKQMLAPPLRVAEQFYSKNGVPIEEDLTYPYAERYDIKEVGKNHQYYMVKGRKTAVLHFDREPRFYSSLGFDGAYWYGGGHLEENDLPFQAGLTGEFAGGEGYHHSTTGYLPKKLLPIKTVLSDRGKLTNADVTWPRIRLADLYLMYAEALNETLETPSQEVYEYIDKVRTRAGLKGVVESWQKFSRNKNTPSTKDGMRKIIHRERLIELAFEGSRFYDLRRWKVAHEYMNKPIKGWTISGQTAEVYYNVRTIYELQFYEKDYLWPLRINTLTVNTNLVQNPGW